MLTTWEAFCRDACAAHALALEAQPQLTNRTELAVSSLYRFGCRSSTTIVSLLQLLERHPHDDLLRPLLDSCTDEWLDYRCSLHSHPVLHARWFQHNEPDPLVMGDFSARVFAHVTVGNLFDNPLWNARPLSEPPTLARLQRLIRRHEASERAAAGKLSLAAERLAQPALEQRVKAEQALASARPQEHLSAVEAAHLAMVTAYQASLRPYQAARAPIDALLSDLDTAIHASQHWPNLVSPNALETPAVKEEPLPSSYATAAQLVLPLTTDTDSVASTVRVDMEKAFPPLDDLDQAQVDSPDLRAFLLDGYRCMVRIALYTVASTVAPLIKRACELRPFANEAYRVLCEDLASFGEAMPAPTVPQAVQRIRDLAQAHDRHETVHQLLRMLSVKPGRGWSEWRRVLQQDTMVQGNTAAIVVNAENQVLRSMELEHVRVDGTRTARAYLLEYQTLLQRVRDRLKINDLTIPTIASPVPWHAPAQPWYVDADVWARAWESAFKDVAEPSGAVKRLHYARIRKLAPTGAPQLFSDIAQAWLALWALHTLSSTT